MAFLRFHERELYKRDGGQRADSEFGEGIVVFRKASRRSKFRFELHEPGQAGAIDNLVEGHSHPKTVELKTRRPDGGVF